MILYPLIAVCIIAADQASKYAVRTFMQPGARLPVLGDWLSFYYVRNTGTAFSMFSGNKFVTLVLTSILICVCLVMLIRELKDGRRITPLLLTMIMAGGISNLIDRVILGYVTDMISCWSFAVFNVADIFVTCGCILLVLCLLFTMKDNGGRGGADDH